METTVSRPSTAPRYSRVERYDTIVIGAGQAGLAAGQQLAASDVDFVIVDSEARVGDNWRRRWDSLRLFTPAKYSGLPGMPFPASPYHLPTKDDVADYLERDAERFDLPLRLDTQRGEPGHQDGLVVTGDHRALLEARTVVVATGAYQRPRIPAAAKELSPEILQIHSSGYRNPLSLPDGPALVVGAGNSGAQIAIELARFRKTWLAGRDTGHLPRRFLGRDLFDWIWPVLTRITTDSRLGRRIGSKPRRGDALIGIPERQLRDAGVERVGRIESARDGLPVCGDRTLEPRVIVWCTGYSPDYSWIEFPVADEQGRLRHQRGAVTGRRGLFFMGQPFQYSKTSSLIGGVGADATFVAGEIAKICEAAAV